MYRRPNIVFLIADDHRFDALGIAGNPVVETPVLDRLATRGVLFERAHMMGGMCAAVCVPARVAIHTGRSPWRGAVGSGLDDYPGAMTMRPDCALLGETFRQAGYETFITGKWHNDRASLRRSFAAGRAVFLGGMSDPYRVPVVDIDNETRRIEAKHATELFTDAALQFLRERRADRPYFLYVGLTSPHDPRVAPPEYHARYRPETIPLPPNCWPEHPFDNGELDVRDEQLAPRPRTPEAVRRHLADYYAMITHHDAQLGRLLAAVDGSDTIVVYTSDHGLALGQHGLFGKQNCYDHSVRVPLILSGPEIPRGRQIAPVVYSCDLFPTLCDLAGIPVPATVETQSLAPLITSAVAKTRDYVGSQYKDLQTMVSDGRWKLIRYQRSPATGKGTDRRQLFDLESDRWETNDLSGSPAHQAQLQRLEQALAAWPRR